MVYWREVLKSQNPTCKHTPVERLGGFALCLKLREGAFEITEELIYVPSTTPRERPHLSSIRGSNL